MRISSSHACTMVSLTCLHSASVGVCSPWGGGRSMGVHCISLSPAWQWGQRTDGFGVRLRGYGMVLASGGAVVEGRGSSHSLSLRGLLRFTFHSSPSTPPPSSSFPCACCSHLHMAPFTNSVGSDVDDKRADFVGHGDATE